MKQDIATENFIFSEMRDKECGDRSFITFDEVDSLLFNHNRENANVPKGPEAVNLAIAESIFKEYMLNRVFSKCAVDMHKEGSIKIHDLGMPRPYCSGQNIAYVAKYGLDLPTSLSAARPAKTAEILIEHIVKFTAMLQCNFAGAIGWDAVNLFLAPYIVGYDDKRIKQCAQMLVYEFAQQAVARGGQAAFSDLNIYWEVPKHYREIDAIGPGGAHTGLKYKDYSEESKKFAKALFEVYLEGDAHGKPFFFPKSQVHISKDMFREPDHDEFLSLVCKVASEKGNPYFLFDRGEDVVLAQCCRLWQDADV